MIFRGIRNCLDISVFHHDANSNVRETLYNLSSDTIFMIFDVRERDKFSSHLELIRY